MTWYEKIQIINNGLNEAVNLLLKYVNCQKFFLVPEHLECRLVFTFFTESRLAAWRFLKLTIRVEPSFYKPIVDNSAGCTIDATVYMALHLKSSVLKVKKFSTMIQTLIYLTNGTLQYFSICCLLSFLR